MENKGFVLSVSQLNRYVKSVLEQDKNLQTVYVRGEISNFKNHYSTGHYYMTIKDEFSAVKAVMFKSANARLRFMPENDMSVIVKGRLSVYERDGQYQLYIDDMEPDGAGALSIAFEQLKKKLLAEGLFDESKKKKIPQFPERVGVVTSASGAAIRDIINVISRRYPLCELILCPVSVQGENAAPQIKAAIELFNRKKAADVLIVGRGGGSVEDLWAFNEEIVARTVAASDIPVISAVGHETDFTICDFAADMRAPTPSAAAELAVPDKEALFDRLCGDEFRMFSALSSKISGEASALDSLLNKLMRLSPEHYLNDMQMRIANTSMRMEKSVENQFSAKKSGFSALCSQLDALSPLKILSRGFGAVSKGGKIVADSAELTSGDMINVRLGKGSADCKVVKVNN